MNDDLIEVKRNPWADHLFRPLVLTVMIMCFNVALINLAQAINPAWNGFYFLLGMLLTTLEAVYSYRFLKRSRWLNVSLLQYRLAELAVLIMALKILSFVGKPVAQIGAELQHLWQDPGYFFNFEFYIVILLAMIAWLTTTETMTDFDALYDPYTFRSDQIVPLDELAMRFFWGGILIVLLSGITQWATSSGWASLLDWQRPSLGGIVLNVLIYFTLGLVLLSQAHLTTLQTRWRIQKIAVASNLAKQWAWYGLIFLGLLMLIDLVLPTRYTLGFLASAGLVVDFLLNLIFFLGRLLLVLLLLPLAWLFNTLFGQTSPEGSAGPPTLPQYPDFPAAGSTDSWVDTLRSLIFWLITGAMIWYLLKIYLSEHPEIEQGLRRFKIIAILFTLTSNLWLWLTGLIQAGWEALPPLVNRRGRIDKNAARTLRRRWAGLGGLSPRERILYYYLNVLQRVEKEGLARRQQQTPFEYEPELSQVVPEAQPAVNLLTQAFVRARYSQEPFEETQANLVRALWQKIRRELNHIRVASER
ncbi:MAG: DUF4129 domain-containing protein [Anaerolineae bacterium]